MFGNHGMWTTGTLGKEKGGLIYGGVCPGLADDDDDGYPADVNPPSGGYFPGGRRIDLF